MPVEQSERLEERIGGETDAAARHALALGVGAYATQRRVVRVGAVSCSSPAR